MVKRSTSSDLQRKLSMIHLWALLLLLGCASTSAESASGTVSLKLKTTGCHHNCVFYEDSKCPSSINVNGKEMSSKKDGFNILVVNPYSGRTRNKHFRWYSEFSVFQRNTFSKFFKDMKSTNSTVVVIVLQNMCRHQNDNWLQIAMKSAQMNIAKVNRIGNTAIIVGCINTCPNVIYGTLPYSYSGYLDQFEIDITFQVFSTERDAIINPTKEPDGVADKKSNNLVAIVCGALGALILLSVAVMAFIVWKRRADVPVCVKRKQVLRNGDDQYVEVNAPSSAASTPHGRRIESGEYTQCGSPKYATIGDGVKPQENIYEYIEPKDVDDSSDSSMSDRKMSGVTPSTSRNHSFSFGTLNRKASYSVDPEDDEFISYANVNDAKAMYDRPSRIPSISIVEDNTPLHYMDMSSDTNSRPSQPLLDDTSPPTTYVDMSGDAEAKRYSQLLLHDENIYENASELSIKALNTTSPEEYMYVEHKI